MAIGLVMGIILERGILRLVYGKDEVIIVLVTYAAFLILEDVIVLIWGPQSYAGLSADGGGRQYRDRRSGPFKLRHHPGRDRGRARRRSPIGR